MRDTPTLPLLLAVSDRAEHVASLREITAAGLRCTVHAAVNCSDAMDKASQGGYAVLLTASTLPDGDWRDLLHFSLGLWRPPRLIVFCTQADERLWAEVLNLGGFDLLLTPFRSEEVVPALDLASRSWRDGNWAACIHPEVTAVDVNHATVRVEDEREENE